MARITDLPVAGPITGLERIPVSQNGVETGVAVGGAKVMPSQGSATGGDPISALAFNPNQTGGKGPAYFDGSQWKTLRAGRPNTNYDGLGVWMVGVGLSVGPAHAVRADTGFYFVSEDGFVWNLRKCTFLDGGFTNTAYANGCFLAGGFSIINIQTGETGGFVTTCTDPRNDGDWESLPPGAAPGIQASTPQSPTSYDNNTGIFNFSFVPGGAATVTNLLPSSSSPDPTWPHIGQNVNDPAGNNTSVLGMGRAGPVEVRIGIKSLVLPEARDVLNNKVAENPPVYTDMASGGSLNLASFANIPYESRFIQARKLGTSDYFGTHIYVTDDERDVRNMLAGASANSVGLSLRGLVWGIINELAVQFAPGGT